MIVALSGTGRAGAMSFCGIAFAFAGYLMVRFNRRLTGEQTRRNGRWLGGRLARHLDPDVQPDGRSIDIRNAGLGFMGVGAVMVIVGLLRVGG